MRKIAFFIIWSLLLVSALAVVLGAVSIKKGWIGYMPPLEELQNPISRYASQVISADGKVLGTWSRSENRVFVDYDSISSHMINALIATEDVRFYDHSGIDIRALMRAIVKRGIFQKKEAGGGSTITQQLAKQLYSSTAGSKMERLFQKPIEWVIAVEIERYYTKEEIITLYLNYFDFLHNAVGIKTAAQVYFGKLPKDLTITEAAMLVGMCKNPSYYNPVRFPERCLARRNIVLQQMEKYDYLSEEELEELKTEPLGLNFRRIDHKEGLAPYLREYLRKIMMAEKPQRADYPEWQSQVFYEDSLSWENNPLYGWCKKNTKDDGSNYDIYTDGLKVYTTIDSRMQRYAEEAVRKHVGGQLQPQFEKEKKNSSTYPYSRALTREEVEKILNRAMRQSDRYRLMKRDGASEAEIEEAFKTKTPMTVFTYQGEKDTVMTPMDSIKYYKSFLRAGLMSIEPATGYVKAYVGGTDYAHFQYDMCMMGRRQVGSTIKPFVYSLAMEDGMLPTDLVVNEQRTYEVPGSGPWTPRNGSQSRYGEKVTLKWGLSQSNNWVTAALMDSVDRSGQRLKKLLGEFGVVNPDIHPSISLCLGPCDITVAEMASAYTAFANKGIRTAPILVSRIEDSEGNVLAEFHPRMNEVISETSSYYMVDMLQAVINQGTGYRLRYRYGFDGPIAGKTGTTNRNSDGWFVGFVPSLVSACWVGGEDRDIHFNTTASGQGASTALPIWALYMKEVFNDKSLGYDSAEKFQIPKDLPMEHEELLLDPLPEESEEDAGGIDTLFD
ncbi:MAG: transglycosylase domain-containing protein [Bacteroidaceae bacterium]|nr:transglycosylase domain-containing protein [Bacteroidaceae bacterium]